MTVELPSGQHIGYARYGQQDGAPVVCFHGAPACRLMFAGADEPAKRFGLELIAPDRFGYGATPFDREATLERRTDEHISFTRALGLERFAIIGVSGGAPYAAALAARLGSKVTALALVSPMGPIAEALAEPPNSRPVVALGHRLFFQRWPLRRRTIFHAAMRLGYRGLMAKPDLFANLFVRLVDSADRRLLTQPQPSKSFIGMILESLAHGPDGGLADLDVYARPWNVNFAAIKARCLMWQGTSDHVVPMQVAFWLARRLPNCRIIRLDGAGHFWALGRMKDIVSELASEIAVANAA